MDFAVFDIEARNWTRYVVGGFYDGENFSHFGKLQGFFDFLESNYRIPSRIFCHYGGQYDFLFLLRHAYAHGYKVGTIIPRGSGLLCVDIRVGSRNFIFYDSSALLGFSLRRLTENFDVETKKGEIDYEKIKVITPELLEYLRSDCVGLWEVLHRFYSTKFIQEAGPAVTIASQALKVMQNYLKEPLHSLTDEVDEFVRSGYFGGRTEIFRPVYQGSSWKQLHCFDVNSLYPTQMHREEFPNKFKRWTRRMGDSSLGYYEATVDVPRNTYLPILGAVINKKLLFPVGKFRGIWSSLELRYAEEQGVKIKKIHKGAEFHNGGRVFKEFVESIYAIRENSEKSSVDNQVAKLILNSSYGKLAIRRKKENIVSISHADDFYDYEPWRELKCGKKNIMLLKKETTLKTFSNVAMGAWVTAAGRIHMHRIMKPIQREIYYMDTDSVFTTKNLSSGAGLGALKHEYSVNRACFLLPKTYLCEGDTKKIVMKGFDSRKIKHFTYEDFYATLNGELGILKIQGEKKFAKFKTASKAGKFLIMKEQGKKEIRSRYDKRTITRQGKFWNTKPIEVNSESKK